MVLLALVPLWLLMLVLVSAMCRTARAGDLAAARAPERVSRRPGAGAAPAAVAAEGGRTAVATR